MAACNIPSEKKAPSKQRTTGDEFPKVALAASVPDSRFPPVTVIRGIGPKTAESLARLGIATVADLLTHYPRRYEDRARFAPIASVQDGETVTLVGKVTAVENRPTKNRLMLTKVTLDDGSRTLATLTWFNQWRMKQVFDPLLGKRVVAHGTAKRGYAVVELAQPEWEGLDDEDDPQSLSIGRIVPIYPATEGVSQKTLRKAVYAALTTFAGQMPDLLPPYCVQKHGFPSLTDALNNVHFPPDFDTLAAARQRLAYEELLVLQTMVFQRKRSVQSEGGFAFAETEAPVSELEAVLPFRFTDAQRRVISEIASDMTAPIPMNRLVQGDVGSGKTVVALAALTIAVRNGYQAALMAPTEILAEQHFRNLQNTLFALNIPVELLSGSLPNKQKTAVRQRVASGETPVVVGTHALIQESVTFARLGLAVIDEQHRFGVLQRAALASKASGQKMPDVLVMTATPIPRTLTLTVYGDLEVSLIDQLPPGRKPVKTHWKPPAEKDKVYTGIRQLLQMGRQAYVVCPLVAESEKLTAQAATETAAHLQTHIFPEFTVGLLHGQMSAEEKDTVMEQFRAGAIHLLVATTVIEVGVDVPNAAAIVIEDADRFGLAQLHQLRGRVGRGKHASFCVLLSDTKTPVGRQRMDVMCQTNDGFRIAEADLELRGPGEFYGVRQSGLANLKIADVIRDTDLLREARTDAGILLSHDPTLTRPEHQALRQAIQERQGNVIIEA